MKKGKLVVIAVVGLMLVFPATEGFLAEWHEVVQNVGTYGSINWSEGIITSVGIGSPPEKYYGKPQARPMALRAAQLDAYRNLLEVIKGVRINSVTVVEDSMVASDVIRSQVDGMVKGAHAIKKEYLSDGTVEVTVAMSLRGGFAQLILPQDIKQVPEIKTIAPAPPAHPGEETVGGAAVPAPPQPTIPTPAPAIYTGLVVDARGLGARPAMSPKILDERGQEVYGSAYVSREFAVQQGMAGYAKDLTASQTNPRVTNQPLTVKGLKTEGPGGADLVISNADADTIRGASENLSFLRKCRVMIVVD
ncbi:MAG: LPP20 family lipoprotein [Desulfobacterales bacterium]|nr:MAG: LPP20 family lipoprotein [Desulfobacterales bacterium]